MLQTEKGNPRLFNIFQKKFILLFNSLEMTWLAKYSFRIIFIANAEKQLVPHGLIIYSQLYQPFIKFMAGKPNKQKGDGLFL